MKIEVTIRVGREEVRLICSSDVEPRWEQSGCWTESRSIGMGTTMGPPLDQGRDG